MKKDTVRGTRRQRKPLSKTLKMHKRALWYGYECEGALQNYYTAFVARGLSDKATAGMLAQNVGQLFLTEKFKDWAWLKKIWSSVSPKIVVTKACYPGEVSKLRKKLVGVRLFVRITPAPWMKEMAPGDQISIGTPYDLSSVQVSNMIVTHPWDYDLDHVT